jgi:hypothetical protein
MAPKSNVEVEVKPDLVEIELVRGYVPRAAIPAHNDVFKKLQPGTVVELPREEARHLLREGIARINADLI